MSVMQNIFIFLSLLERARLAYPTDVVTELYLGGGSVNHNFQVSSESALYFHSEVLQRKHFWKGSVWLEMSPSSAGVQSEKLCEG